MGQTTIGWTNATWNPCVGCTKVSPGCAHCYAEKMAARLKAMALADIAIGKDPGKKRHYIDVIDDKGRWNGRVVAVREALGDPLKWKAPRMVFVNSMSDLFHDDVSDGFILDVFRVMAQCQHHQFQVLTKRPERAVEWFRKWCETDDPELDIQLARGPEETRRKHTSARAHIFADMVEGWGEPPAGAAYPTFDWMEGMRWWPNEFHNVWIGVSAEDQKRADERIPELMKIPAAVRFVSYEPALGPIDFMHLNAGTPQEFDCLHGWKPHVGPEGANCDRLDWIIVGGESGPGARAFDLRWARKTVEQCKRADVPVFVKQMGSMPFDSFYTTDQRVHFKHRKGEDMAEWPDSLRVQEFPQIAAVCR